MAYLRMNREDAPKLSGRILLITVGAEAREFRLHEDLICATSDYFRTMMQSKFKESESCCVILDKDDPVIFEIYYVWLYTKRILRFVKDEDENTALPETWLPIVKTFVLGEKLGDISFQDCVIDVIVAMSNHLVVKTTRWNMAGDVVTTMVYDNTLPKSPLRRLLVDQHVHFGAEAWLTAYGPYERYCKEFLFDLAMALLAKRPGNRATIPYEADGNTCHYHEHEAGKENCHKHKIRK